MIGPDSGDVLDTLRGRIFQLQERWEGGGHSGTCFSIAKQPCLNRLIVATARHILVAPNDRPVTWTFRGYDSYGRLVREAVATTDARSSRGLPYSWHKDVDVGIFELPERASDGTCFLDPAEPLIQPLSAMTLQGEGTRVGWAGYAGVVEGLLKQPRLCYFEGVISATLNTHDTHLYLVDGHIAQGVSGAPVWHWCKEKQLPEVLGVACAYGLYHEALPGFCFVEPINHIVHYLTAWQKEQDAIRREFERK